MHNDNDLISPDDRRLLIREAQEGSQEAFEELLKCYAPLLESMTARFCGTSVNVQDREDLRQEAVVAFYRALKSFDCTRKGIQFGLYAKDCIRNGLISHLRKVKRHENVILLDDAACVDEDAEYNDPAVLMAEKESYLELSRRVHEALSAYENRIWWLYLSGRTAREVAVVLETNEKSVQNAIYRIRRKLRSVISDTE